MAFISDTIIAAESTIGSIMNPQVPRVIVGALIRNSNNLIFLMKSSGKYGSQWIVPGGKVDFGESLIPALRREIKEETNLELGDIKFCEVTELIEPSRHFVFHEYTALALNPTEVNLNHEASEYGWFSRDGLKEIDIAAPTLAFINNHAWSQR